MELRLKPLLILLFLLLGGAAGAILWLPIGVGWTLPWQGETPIPPFKATLFPSATTSQAEVRLPVEIHFADNDPRWNWQWNPSCDPALQDFVQLHGGTGSLAVTLVNSPTLPLGVAFPTVENAEALVLSQCAGDNDNLRCAVSVSKGVAGKATDVAAIASLLFGVQEYARPKVEEAWKKQPTWDWSAFAPFITQKEGRWQSDCLTISAE